RPITFAEAIEPARTEYFLRGTDQPVVAQATAAARRPRITSPVPGTVYALDPDIPMSNQLIRLTSAGAAAGERLQLDGRDVGEAAASPLVYPARGPHRLALVDGEGRTLDRTLFTVR
ncbi:MAG: penicillin-binding protein, partial [Sphingomonadales bacterium]|nr:penicillin-binding protein [Sphingomonadales bacterium]